MISATSSPSRRGYCPRSSPASAISGTTKGLDYLPDGLPIRGVAGDQQASLVGQGCLEEGQAKCTYGTGAFLLVHTGGRVVPSTRGLVTTLAACLDDGPPRYALEGSVFIAGAAVQWFRDGLKAVGAAPEVDRLSESADPASGVLFVPALTGLGAPYWEPEARGTLFGLTRGTSVADLARATLEGVAFQILDLIEAMNADLPTPLRELRVDGGMARSDPFLGFQADLLGLPIRRSPQAESTALGAALLAGLGVGLWPDPEAAVALLQDGGRAFEPRRDDPWRLAALARWRAAVETVRRSLSGRGVGAPSRGPHHFRMTTPDATPVGTAGAGVASMVREAGETASWSTTRATPRVSRARATASSLWPGRARGPSRRRSPPPRPRRRSPRPTAACPARAASRAAGPGPGCGPRSAAGTRRRAASPPQ